MQQAAVKLQSVCTYRCLPAGFGVMFASVYCQHQHVIGYDIAFCPAGCTPDIMQHWIRIHSVYVGPPSQDYDRVRTTRPSRQFNNRMGLISTTVSLFTKNVNTKRVQKPSG